MNVPAGEVVRESLVCICGQHRRTHRPRLVVAPPARYMAFGACEAVGCGCRSFRPEPWPVSEGRGPNGGAA